ncbi:MAG: hypothetical protein E5V66_23470 [Mesorhizobium sp.]|uniref:hypothetical protein n=1 Tax=Mesorhizobium sp. TaxID=1871066 RepID=UPI001207C2A2|nr:hypothetical protein [Mesorhizobium sp.]TIV81765.1 MAG: hypothetical protein E5V64_14895 [Mesorhizobium sp.]TIW09245.1 MAG: hypothetical protein E5V66_23470 [Mesorhizobium sp.]
MFVPHVRIPWQDGIAAIVQPDNLVHRARNAEETWIEEATGKIGEWRSLTRSVYLRWAITINASTLAEQRYREIPGDQALRTNTLRMVEGRPGQVPLTIWPAREAAEHYAAVTPLIAAYGAADLFGALEDVVFDLYEIFLRHNPEPLMRGNDYQVLRRTWRQRSDSDDSAKQWQSAWNARFETWRRKRAYDGLHQVLLALFEHAGLQRPSFYQLTDVADWARTLEMVAELRHLIVHGAATVSDRLAALSNTPTSMTFDFVAGEPLDVKLHHLQSIECFCDQLLTAINMSLMERAVGPLRQAAEAAR